MRALLLVTLFAVQANAAPDLLEHLLLIEAEQCVDESGAPIGGKRGVRSTSVFINSDSQASGEGFITPLPSPYRNPKPFAKPVEARTEVEIPKAGRWYAHVRYRLKPPSASRQGTEFHAFEVVIGGQKLTVANRPPAGRDEFDLDNPIPVENFQWAKFPIELPAGKTVVVLRMPALAGPDCVLLTPVAEYTPDIRDHQGPVWLRFKAVEGAKDPFSILVRCSFNPYEEKLPKTAGWLFKDEVAPTGERAAKLQKDAPRLLNAGEWSPWVKTFTATKKYCFASAELTPGADEIEVAFEAATRPDENFVFHRGVEVTGLARKIYVLLPTAPGLEAKRREVRSFSDWGAERLAALKQLGFQAGEGPRRIQVGTSLTSVDTPGEVDTFLEICRHVGFNGCEIGHPRGDTGPLWDRVVKDGYTWTHAHHLAPAYWVEKWLELPATPPTGKTMQQVVDEFWYRQSMNRVQALWGKRPAAQRQLIALANLVDEPGPMPSFIWANHLPAVKLCFHEFLRANGLKPESFGKTTWDEVNLIGYVSGIRAGTIKTLAKLNLEVEGFKPSAAAPVDAVEALLAAPPADDEEMPPPTGDTTRKRIQVPLTEGMPVASPAEKRQYYWTQRFRSYFTRHFYGQTARVIEDLSRQGWLRADIKSSPNFQAAPIMETRMWDGGLDLFEWAREGTSNCLMMEDWINDHYRVGFGFTLFNAAARKRGQSLGFLIVADRHFRQRYLTGLALGVQTFADYVYGPLATIGPAWAGNAEAVRDRAEVLRWTRRVEDDLLATKLRPAETAILVANSAEINTAYYSATGAEAGLRGGAFGARPLFRRAGIYSALLDGNVPAEIVSEIEILEDKALDRYKVLYVTDTHVATAAQEAIKAWVKRGGTLWADFTALARNEFDENSDLMNEVFGLATRGPLPAAADSAEHDEEVARVVDGSVEGPLVVKPGKGKEGVPEKITVESTSFDGSAYRPAWKLSAGKALGTFADGSPAVVQNEFGKGRAVLVGCSALMFSPYAKQAHEHPEFAKVRDVVVRGAPQFCRVSVPRVNAYVRDGTNQTVLVLINSTTAPQAGVDVRLTVPQVVKSAFDARGQAVTFTQKNGEVKFSRNLTVDDGEIVVFKW